MQINIDDIYFLHFIKLLTLIVNNVVEIIRNILHLTKFSIITNIKKCIFFWSKSLCAAANDHHQQPRLLEMKRRQPNQSDGFSVCKFPGYFSEHQIKKRNSHI